MRPPPICWCRRSNSRRLLPPAWFTLGDIARAARRPRRRRSRPSRRPRPPIPTTPRRGLAADAPRRGSRPAPCRRAMCSTLFDQYAPRFDAALLQRPRLSRAGAAASTRSTGAATAEPTHFSRVLDLGCGTGSAARPSAPSCRPARRRRSVAAHDRDRRAPRASTTGLVDADLLHFLRGERHNRRAHDLCLAADVFVYVDDLAPVLDAPPACWRRRPVRLHASRPMTATASSCATPCATPTAKRMCGGRLTVQACALHPRASTCRRAPRRASRCPGLIVVAAETKPHEHAARDLVDAQTTRCCRMFSRAGSPVAAGQPRAHQLELLARARPAARCC